jgi:23S rRNA (cytosine1962-C5)-methyltransferase
MTSITHPRLRLRPKGGSRFRTGAPWVYSDELVLDRRTRALTPGTIVTLEDAERKPIATGAFHPNSKIGFRVLERQPDIPIDRAWFEAKLAHALALRTRLFDAPFYRLIHAEADGLPGVIIDRFGDAVAIQPNAAWADVLIADLAAAVQSVTGVSTVIKNGTGRARALDGLPEETTVLQGGLDGIVDVPMNGAIYQADLLGGQKTGLYYDQRPNHAFAARLTQNARVLDVFSHVGGFGLAALAGGAAHATSVDGSAPALALAEAGAAKMGMADKFTTRKGDAFDVMTAMAGEDARFEVVICDPPAFAPNKAAAEAGLRAYERVARLAAKLVTPGGYLVLCSCSHAADLARFRQASTKGVHRAGRASQIIHTGEAGPDHPVHPGLAESAYLKALFLRLD